MHLSTRVTTMADSGTSKARNHARSLQAQGIDVIDLSAGELDYALFEEVEHGARLALDHPRHRYTPILGLPTLRAAIAARVSADTNCVHEAREIGLSAGAKPALYYALLALTEPGDEVVVPLPCWGTFLEQIRVAGAVPVTIPPSLPDFRLDVERLYAAVGTRTKVLIVNTPCNPTGALLDESELKALARFVRATGVVLFLDECYSRLLRQGAAHLSILEIDPGLKDRVVTFNSYSKAYAMAGWRLGYFTGPPHVVEAVQKLQGHLASNPGSIAQHALCHALTCDDTAYLAQVNAYLDENHRHLIEILGAFPEVLHYYPQGAFYAFLSTQGLAGGTGANPADPERTLDFAQDLLLRKGVATTDGAAFGTSGYLRLSYAARPAAFREGLARLVDYIGDCRAGLAGPLATAVEV
jgi:aspartate aminotransferase